jgi:hypothetical protein
MKTAMQELIEWCNSCLTDKTMSKGGRIALEVTILRASDLLEKEKEQIKEAFIMGEDGVPAEQYYNQTYNQKSIDAVELLYNIVKKEVDELNKEL